MQIHVKPPEEKNMNRKRLMLRGNVMVFSLYYQGGEG